ncbi:MAG: hypothetical protein SPE31_08480 [Prevotella sp.]|nr:hypothetical protein [Prevotella sp.]
MRGGEKGERKQGEGREKARKRERESEEKFKRRRGEGREKARKKERESKEKGEKARKRERESQKKGERTQEKGRKARTDIIVMDTILNKISFILRYTRSED